MCTEWHFHMVLTVPGMLFVSSCCVAFLSRWAQPDTLNSHMFDVFDGCVLTISPTIVPRATEDFFLVFRQTISQYVVVRFFVELGTVVCNPAAAKDESRCGG